MRHNITQNIYICQNQGQNIYKSEHTILFWKTYIPSKSKSTPVSQDILFHLGNIIHIHKHHFIFIYAISGKDMFGKDIRTIHPFQKARMSDFGALNIQTPGYPNKMAEIVNTTCVVTLHPKTQLQVDIIDLTHNITTNGGYCVQIENHVQCAENGYWPHQWNLEPDKRNGTTVKISFSKMRSGLVGSRFWIRITGSTGRKYVPSWYFVADEYAMY